MDNPEYIEKIVRIIPKEVDKISGLINQLRDYANPPALSVSSVMINEMIDKVLIFLDEEFRSHKILVEKRYAADVRDVWADRDQLEKICMNLFMNAIEAMPDGGEVTVSGYMDGEDEGQTRMYELLESGDVVDCEIVFPAKIGKTWSFKAGVTKFTTAADVDDAITFDATLKVSGKPTLAATTSV